MAGLFAAPHSQILIFMWLSKPSAQEYRMPERNIAVPPLFAEVIMSHKHQKTVTA